MRPYYEHSGVTIYHGDCREIVPSLSPADVVVTDPPYGDTSLHWDVPVSERSESPAHANAAGEVIRLREAIAAPAPSRRTRGLDRDGRQSGSCALT